jgi:hypothetical protein
MRDKCDVDAFCVESWGGCRREAAMTVNPGGEWIMRVSEHYTNCLKLKIV